MRDSGHHRFGPNSACAPDGCRSLQVLLSSYYVSFGLNSGLIFGLVGTIPAMRCILCLARYGATFACFCRFLTDVFCFRNESEEPPLCCGAEQLP